MMALCTLLRTLLSIILLGLAALAEAQTVPYGKNPAAGHYATVPGVRLYYETYGKGRPLLLLHGNSGSIGRFSKTIPFFEKQNRVIAVDSRAHGKSVDGGDSLSFEMMADDMAALLAELHIDSADVIGWSDGGIIALVLAMRHPQKVRRLVATGANLWPDSTALLPSLWRDMEREFAQGRDSVYTDPVKRNARKVFLLDYLHPHISTSALKAVKAPAFIIAGDRDLIVGEHTLAIYKALPKAWLWIVPNCGHATLIDKADEFNHKVAEFLGQRQL